MKRSNKGRKGKIGMRGSAKRITYKKVRANAI